MNTIKLNTIGEAPIKKGGASGGGGESNYVYYRASVGEVGVAASYSSVVKAEYNGFVIFLPFSDATYSGMNILEYGFDTNLKVTHPIEMTMTTLGELIAGMTQTWIKITEEEFYGL